MSTGQILGIVTKNTINKVQTCLFM